MKKSKIRMEDLPCYEITLEEDGNQGIRMVSLVKDPAIEMKGMYFSETDYVKEQTYKFKTIEDKQIVVGPAMIPNKKILRKDENDMPYFVMFRPEVIKQMVDKFNKENNNKSINVDHSDRMVDAFIQQNWIIESSSYDKSKFYGFNNLPIGTWFIEVKVEDAAFWATEVKEEGKYGFSIEGLMGQSLMEYSMDSIIDSLTEDELYDMFISIDDIDTHPNCRCEIDMDMWVIMPDACDICREMQAEFNVETAKGNVDYARDMYKKHKGI